MQNQHQCGCDRGFVPVNGNWDFNMDRGCQTGCARRENRRSSCQQCERETIREREEDCQCGRCDDDRQVKRCAQNTVLRDMEECACAAVQRGSRNEESSREARRCRSEREERNECSRCRSEREERNECNRCRNEREERNECNRCRSEREERSECSRCRSEREERNECSRCRSEREERSECSRCHHGDCWKCHVGMVNVKMQEIDETFESGSALRAGTLFPELHMPLNGYCPSDHNCGTCEQAAAFAAWEMRLFLDTHPHDEQALCLFRKLCKEAAEENYATTFLTDDCCTSAWNWVKNPWPWEENCRCGNASGCGCRNA